jgi:hypothetical protein
MTHRTTPLLLLACLCSSVHAADLPDKAKGGLSFTESYDLGWRSGPKYDYQGVMPWSRWPKVALADAAVFRYLGPAENPAIKSGSNGAVLSGLNLWRQAYNPLVVEWDKAVGYRFADPASSTVIQHASLAGWDTAILLAKSDHTECFTFSNLHSYANRVFFRNEENQAVSHRFECIFSHREFETLFEFADVPQRRGGGGNISFDTVVVQYPGRVFDIQKSNVNSCTFTVTNLKVDGGTEMKNWRLIRQRNGPLNFTCRGHIGYEVQPAEDAIDVADASNCDVQLWWKGRIWPRDYRFANGKWELK